MDRKPLGDPVVFGSQTEMHAREPASAPGSVLTDIPRVEPRTFIDRRMSVDRDETLQQVSAISA